MTAFYTYHTISRRNALDLIEQPIEAAAKPTTPTHKHCQQLRRRLSSSWPPICAYSADAPTKIAPYLGTLWATTLDLETVVPGRLLPS